MHRTKLFVSFILLFALIAPVVSAQTNFRFFGQPLVPLCGTKNVCTACDIFRLLQNLINFFASIAVLLAIVMLAYGGILILFAGASPGLLEKGKKVIKRALFGVVIVFTAWLLVDTVIKILVGQEVVGGTGQLKGIGRPWNQIECNAPAFPLGSIKGGSSGGLSIEDWEAAQGDEGTALKNPQGDVACVNTSTYNNAINEAAARYGVSPERIRAIIAVESGGRPGAESNDNDGKHSYGLMQIRPETAQTFDPSATVEKLKDPAYNIDLGTRYYKKLKDQYGSDDLASAAYSGGHRGNKPSVNCAGENSPFGGKKRRWECEYDNNAHTVPNRGYQVTRNYIPKVNLVENKYKTGQCA